MRRFIIGIIILIFSVWLGLKMAHDPGLALFTYNNWSVEMPLWFAVICLLALVGLVYLIVRFFDGIDASFYRWKSWLRWRRKNKAYSKTNRGLVELIEGHWGNAETYLMEGVYQSDTPLVNYLAAAKAAHELGAYDKRDMYLRQAHDLAPNADIAIGITQAQLQFDQGQLEQSLATLNHLRTISPTHTVMLKLLKKIYIRLGDWDALLALLPSIRKVKIFKKDQVDQLECQVYQELLNTRATKAASVTVLHEFWSNVPRHLRKNPNMIACYVRHMLVYPEAAKEVENLINHTLKKNWNSDLVKSYGLLVSEDSKNQLMAAEKWTKLYPNQAVLFLVLGRLAMRCQLWGIARSYLEDSLKLAAIPETFIEYGKLFEQLGDIPSALQNYREGLALVER